MSVNSGDTASSPDWGALSEELQALLTEAGPLPYGALLTRYKAMHGRQLVFHGHKLRDSLANGNLKGVRFNTTNHTLELGVEPASTDAPKVLPPAAPTSSPHSALPPDEPLAQELRDLVSGEGPLTALAVGIRYQAMYGKYLNLHGYRLRARLRDGNLPGLRYNKARDTVELTHPLTPHAYSNPLAGELRQLVMTSGPLPLIRVAPLYSSVFHKNLTKFCGRKLKDNLRKGYLKGVRYDQSTGNMALDDILCSDAMETEALPAPPPVVHAEMPAGAADAASPLAEIVAADPAPAKATERPATKQAALQGAGASSTISTKRSQSTFERPASAPKRRVLTSRRVPGGGGASRPSSSTASSASSSSPRATKPPYLLVDNPASCKKALARLCSTTFALEHTLQDVCVGSMVVVQLNGRQLGSEAGFISLIKLQIIGPLTPKAVIFDVVALDRTRAGQALLHNQLCPLLADQRTTKVVHDFNNSAIALRWYFGAGFAIRQVLDLQLAFEAVHGRVGADAASVMRAFGQDASYSDVASRAFSFDEAATSRRPLDTSTLGGAAMAVMSLAKVTDSAVSRLSEERQTDIVLHASQLGTEFAISSMLPDTRRAAFRDHGSCWGGGIGRVLTSFELKKAREISTAEMTALTAPAEVLQSSQPAASPSDGGNLTALFGNVKSFLDNIKLGEAGTAKEDPNSPREILKLVPEEFLQDHLTERHTENLTDVIELVIDEGRRPYATLQERGKLYLCKDKAVVVTKAHIDKVVGRLDSEGRFGYDNRAGVPGQLHRVSVMRSREGGRIYGVTLRIGRYFPGSASVIDDLLFHVQDGPDKPERAASILILGKPGSGKTTVLRDICRKVSEEQTVVIVDTSNEIAGDGDIPHLHAIGQSRRMMVPHKDGQHSVMKEALQNHTPQTIVVDEVSNKLEARACLDIKARGVRIVASAHGDLQSLLKNPELNSLVGGTTSVTLGDQLAKATNGGNKIQSQRAGAPVFDMIVEVERGEVCTWSIVRNADLAVDAILDGQPYPVEKRTCIPREDSDLQQQASDLDDVAFLLKCVNEVEKTRQYY